MPRCEDSTYRMLILVKCRLREDHHSTLIGCVASLEDKNLIGDKSEQLAIQMRFHFVSWLTELFNPLSDITTRIFATGRKEENSPA
jgi:hypothetical protein